jgi:hypothetical protein
MPAQHESAHMFIGSNLELNEINVLDSTNEKRLAGTLTVQPKASHPQA